MPTEVSDDLVLRPATPADAAAVAEVHLSARARAPMPAGIHSDDEVRTWLASRLAVDEVWVVEVDGSVAAYARMTDVWLDDLYVAPGHAGRGLGSALLELVKAQRPDGFSLWVFEMNRPARAFYAARGLIELERTDGEANEERTPDIRMAWTGREPLAFLRRQIDEVDLTLGDLLARRAALTRAVQPHKSDPSRDPVRERQIAEAIAARVPALGPDRVARVVDAIITESLAALGPGGGADAAPQHP